MRRPLLMLAPALLLAAALALTASALAAHRHTRKVVNPKRTYPFQPSPSQRPTNRRDALPPWWADGLSCSVGCRAHGAIPGWPLRPFHHQHALRAGIDERRDSTFHVGIDIQARKNDKVYAIQPGTVRVLVASGAEERVQVGNFIYWHIKHLVHNGQRVTPYKTVLGLIKPGFGHLHLSEVDSIGRYLNPLRPGGRVVGPWRDTAPPVIGRPAFRPGGKVYVKAFDRQSFVIATTYETPVLALAALAWRVFDSHGHSVGPLHWAYRGTQVFPFGLDRAIWAPDARRPGFTCFATRFICKPNWDYVLAGGLAPGLSRSTLVSCGCRLTIYAWDFASNSVARDFSFAHGAAAGAPQLPAGRQRVPGAPPVARRSDRG